MNAKKYWLLLVVFMSLWTIPGTPALSQEEKGQTEYIQHLEEIIRETNKTLMNRERELKERKKQYEKRVRQMEEVIELNQNTTREMAELLQKQNNKYKRITEKYIELRKKLEAYEVVKAASEFFLAKNPKLTESVSPQEKRQLKVYGSSTLQGLQGISPVVILKSTERKELGLAEQSLRTLVEGTLGKAGIRILRLRCDGVHRLDPNIARLIITVETASDKTADEPVYSFRVSSQLLQRVQLTRNRIIETLAPTWSVIINTQLSVGKVDCAAVGGDIVVLMNDQMNEFCKDYLEANARMTSRTPEDTADQLNKRCMIITKARHKILHAAVTQFKMDTGRFPTEEKGLLVLIEPPGGCGPEPGGYLENTEQLKDGWGNNFYYELYPESGKPFVIISFGADGKEGGEGYDADWPQRERMIKIRD